MISIPVRNETDTAVFQNAIYQATADLRVAMPATVVSFDREACTIVAQPAIQEQILINSLPTYVPIDPIADIPVSVYRAGGFAMTLPIQPGDECLLIFSDKCIDGWYQQGAAGGPATTPTCRRHDFSDAIAIFGLSSTPRALPNYSATSAQLRTADGAVVVDVASTGVTVTAPKVTVTASNEVDITAANKVNITGSGHTTIEGVDFLTHQHLGVTTGAGVSGIVKPPA